MVKLVSSPARDVFGQMALDETLVLEHSLNGEALCRFFNWTDAPSATFGYAQFYKSAESQLLAAGIKDFTRRPTGGGIVLHKEDLTFSLIFNCGDNLKARDIYDVLHGLIKENLKLSGVDLDSYQDKSDYRPAPGGINANCFVNPVCGDLMSGGVKVLGGAIRRFGNRTLYQGSLQIKGARVNAIFRSCILKAFTSYLGGVDKVEDFTMPPDMLKRADELALKQYKSAAWKEKF